MKKISLLASGLLLGVSLYAGGDIDPVEPQIDVPMFQSGEAVAYNVALKAGTLGIGMDFSRMISDKVGVRFNVNGIHVNRTEDLDDISYDATLDLLTVGALVDYFPFENAFRLSGGAYYNGNKFEGTATPSSTETIDLGFNTYTGDQIGEVKTNVDFQKFAPYLGLGWGNKSSEKGWGFTFDLGAMYQGSANVEATAVPNPLLPQVIQDQIATDIEQERLDIIEETDDYKWYPVIMIGVNYTF